MPFWLRRKAPKSSPIEPPKALETEPASQLFLGLITALAEQSAKRYEAQLLHEAKLEEIALKRHELEIANSEILAKAEATRKAAAEDLRERRKIAANNHHQKVRGPANALARQRENCPVCQNPGDPALTAMAIQWHHSGHPAQQEPLFNGADS